MAGETVITVVGNLTSDPELRYTQNGLAVANFTIASTPRSFDRASNDWKDGDALFLRASVWREFAEHVAGSLTKGSRVIATGRLKQRSYETKEGEKRTSWRSTKSAQAFAMPQHRSLVRRRPAKAEPAAVAAVVHRSQMSRGPRVPPTRQAATCGTRLATTQTKHLFDLDTALPGLFDHRLIHT
jgi:single stranded DNA-binding protein